MDSLVPFSGSYMAEVIVAILTTIAIIFVVCGFKNRKKHREQEERDSLKNMLSAGRMHGFGHNDAKDEQLFRAELSKAGFKDEAIEEMRSRILEKKGSVSSSDAADIIRALDSVMKSGKYGN